MHKQTDQIERPMRAGHGEKLASRLGSGGNARAGESPAASTISQRLLAMLELSEQTNDAERDFDSAEVSCVFVDMRPEQFEALVNDAVTALRSNG